MNIENLPREQFGDTPETQDITPLWGLAWRTRAAAWMVKNKTFLLNAVR